MRNKSDPNMGGKKQSASTAPRRKKFRFEYMAFLVGIVVVFRWWTSTQLTPTRKIGHIQPAILYTLQSDPNVHVLGSYPHDKAAFTQGLLVESPGILIESTGLYHRSSVRRFNVTTGVASHHTAPFMSTEFGEGITWNAATDSYVVLTWKAMTGYVLHKDDFRVLSTFALPPTTRDQGWGITTITDTQELVVSDGSHVLHVWDPVTLTETRRVSVLSAAGQPVANLNELEYARGYIFANIWYSNLVAQIDPITGAVVNMHDLSSLSAQKNADGDVLNGIAYDWKSDLFYVTGKLWDTMYLVRIDDKPPST
ncbi:hypothetical protein DYB25_010648 [Aphanomyces astaci]|uniref:Glutamine cyclotransferase n=1 Tax=Aphanomyces astaci TaxID=112090 RepID=A0A397BMJ3_APHAT|nr:hypothetical protein DYB25_010648 [Aphanomyces astaci]RHY19510.1 hypothetical protein DYB36_010635 [Aphanomyces astaci]RHY43200.1 hypothetical protein DYB38_011474 [Aphanomyces astaci]RHY46409.1 hypothetical protein DYB30_012344 [Aphanomyces astaci]RHY64160.1 hypothetical protein DYB34_010816 [Aphanomyces astaci]